MSEDEPDEVASKLREAIRAHCAKMKELGLRNDIIASELLSRAIQAMEKEVFMGPIWFDHAREHLGKRQASHLDFVEDVFAFIESETAKQNEGKSLEDGPCSHLATLDDFQHNK